MTNTGRKIYTLFVDKELKSAGLSRLSFKVNKPPVGIRNFAVGAYQASVASAVVRSHPLRCPPLFSPL